jgi:hypothetical protein
LLATVEERDAMMSSFSTDVKVKDGNKRWLYINLELKETSDDNSVVPAAIQKDK